MWHPPAAPLTLSWPPNPIQDEGGPAGKELLLVPYTLRYIYLRRRDVLDFWAIQRALTKSGVQLYGCALAGAFVVVEDWEAAPRDPRRPASAQQQQRCVRKGRLVIAVEGASRGAAWRWVAGFCVV